MTQTRFLNVDTFRCFINVFGSRLLIVFLIGLTSVGCGGTAAEVVQAPKLDRPESFSASGKSWTLKSKIETADEEALTKFFHIRTEFQGSIDFEGPPTMYMSGKSDRRYYWMRGTTEEPVWSCVVFEGGKFYVTERKGNPFTK